MYYFTEVLAAHRAFRGKAPTIIFGKLFNSRNNFVHIFIILFP